MLAGLSFVERFYPFPAIASTNDVARAFTHRPVRGIYCVQADRQTGGRGRRGTPFFSDHAGGLWISLVVPMPDRADHFRFNRAVSLAIARTLAGCGVANPVTIKWPNDIYCGTKKICGILLENHPLFDDVLVIGFGCNINIGLEEFPAELRSIATSLIIESGRRHSPGALLRSILRQFMILSGADQEKIHELYLQQLYGKGRQISINGVQGTYSSVAPDGRLVLMVDGEAQLVTAGSPVFAESEIPGAG